MSMPLSPWRHGQFTQPRAPTDPFFEACCVRTLAGAPHDALDVLGRDTRTSPHLFAQLALPWLAVGAKAAKGRPVQNSGRGSVCGICRGFSTRSAWFITNSLRTCQPPPAPQRSSRKPPTQQQRGCASGIRRRRVQPVPSGASAHPSRRCNTPLRTTTTTVRPGSSEALAGRGLGAAHHRRRRT